MTQNPYTAALQRWFLVVLGALGLAASGFIVCKTLTDGATNGQFSRFASFPGRLWTAAENPTQFWFYVLFWAAVAAIFGGIAWKAWWR